MTFDQLEVLKSIIKTGSFKAASERLHRSQPAISIAIKKLEEEFNVKLFSRDAYRPVLTKEGEAFYDKAKVVLSHTTALETLGKQLGLGNEPEIKIAIEAICPMPLLLPLLKKFFGEYSFTKLKLFIDYAGGALERLREGEADLALSPLLNPHSKLETFPFTFSEMVPVASPNYFSPLNPRSLTLESLKEYTQIIISDTVKHSTKSSFGVLEGANHWVVNDVLIKKQIILAGLGWGGMPVHLIKEELKNKKLIPLKIKGVPSFKFKVEIVRRNDRPVGPVTQKLWNYLCKNNFIERN